MTAEQIRQIQQQVIGLVAGMRSSVGQLQNRVDSIWGDTDRLTPAARQSEVAMVLAEGRTRILGLIEEPRGILNRAYAEVEGTLGNLTAVAPEELAEAERNLRTALGAASQRPELLLNLYRERHLRPADRRLIEGAALGMIDALGSSDNYGFRDSWNSLQQELAAARGPEELEAASHRAVLDELAAYLGNVEELVGIDLTLMDPSLTGESRDQVLITRSLAEAEVNRYETENASVMATTAAM